MGSQTISLCVVTRNSAATLKDCLDSVKALVHEIVIVDTGSTDDTKKIAKEYNAILVDVPQKENELNYAVARNKGLAKASKDWILVLNPEEMVSSVDHNKINTLVSHKTADAYALTVILYTNQANNTFLTENLEPALKKRLRPFKRCVDTSIIRLFRNNSAYRFKYAIFETLEDALVKKKARIGSVTIPIHCIPAASLEQQMQEKRNWLHIVEKECKKNKEDPKLFFDRASLHEDLGEDHEAHGFYVKAAEFDKEKHFLQNTSLCYRIGLFFANHGQMEKAEKWLRNSMIHNPGFKQAYLTLATVFIQNGNARSGLQVLVQALKNNLADVQILNLIGFGLLQDNKTEDAIKMLERARTISEKKDELGVIDLVYNNLFTAYTIKGDAKAAIAVLEEGVKKYPNTLSFYTNLINLFAKTKQTKKALAWGQRALALELEPDMRQHIEESLAKLKGV